MRARPIITIAGMAIAGATVIPGGAHAALPVQMAEYYLDGIDSQTVFIAAALLAPALYLMARVVFRSVRYQVATRGQDKGFDPRVGLLVGGLIAVLMLVRLLAAGSQYLRHLGG